MALTDELKLDIAKSKIKEKIDSIETWQDFIEFLSTVTKAKIKIFIKNNIQIEIDKLRDQALRENDIAIDLEAFKIDVDSI